MNYATIKPIDVANGVGVRTSLFVSGCTHHCKDCFNAETWDFNYGQPFGEEQIDLIIKSLSPSYICGFSLLGGEPFEPSNQAALAPLLEKIKAVYPDKTIWCYSGYLFDKDMLEGKLSKYETTRRMLDCIDILVDGEFVADKKDLTLRFKGSSNQRIIKVRESLECGEIIRWEEDRIDE